MCRAGGEHACARAVGGAEDAASSVGLCDLGVPDDDLDPFGYLARSGRYLDGG